MARGRGGVRSGLGLLKLGLEIGLERKPSMSTVGSYYALRLG